MDCYFKKPFSHTIENVPEIKASGITRNYFFWLQQVPEVRSRNAVVGVRLFPEWMEPQHAGLLG